MIMSESFEDTYHKNGYVVARSMLDAELIVEASAHVEWLLKKTQTYAPKTSDTRFYQTLPSDCVWLVTNDCWISPRNLSDQTLHFSPHITPANHPAQANM